jgi:GTP cyclohydrolase I
MNTLENFAAEQLIADNIREILLILGQDVESEGLIDTPKRVARYLLEFLVNYDPGNVNTQFESVHADQMVIVKKIPFYSLCEHHILPFYGHCSVGYLTGENVIGLSKIDRIVHKHAHKLQLQERLCHDIARELDKILGGAPGVAVYIEATHMCKVMRGIKSSGNMITNVLEGIFREDSNVRNEFLMLVK